MALAASGPWLILLGAVCLLSFVPFARSWPRVFRWEILGALGVLGWTLVGPTPLVLLLLVLWPLGRLWSLARLPPTASTRR